MNIEIEKKEQDGIAHIQVKGEIDMYASSNLINALRDFFKKDIKGIIIDLSEVTYVDSSGIATMVEGYRWGLKEKKKFVIAGACSEVMNVFELTHLKDIFTFSPDSESAAKEILVG